MGSKDKLIIYGNGHMAQMIYDFVSEVFEVIAFTVDSQCITEKVLRNKPVIPFEAIEQSHPPNEAKMITAVGFVGMNDIRQQKHEEGKRKGYHFVNFVHKSVHLHPTVVIGENNIILDHSSIHPGTVIGDGNFVSSNSNLGHGCVVKNYCWINAGVSIGGETTLMNKVFLGINATLGQGIEVKDKTFVGANTLITQSTERRSVYMAPTAIKHRLKSDSFLQFSKSMTPS